MKRALCLILCLTALTILPACHATETPESPETEEALMTIEVVIGDQVFPATLLDNETTQAMLQWLPMTLDMSELNGNEKYHYFESGLPTDARRPNGIQAGDLMLFGDRCIVLFYKSFSTSYSYTPLGKLDDPTGLAEALGRGDMQVTFRLPEEV